MKPLALVAALFLSLPSLFAASADLTVTADSGSLPNLLRAGFHYTGISFRVRNNGPDTATAVKLAVTSIVPITCNGCDDIGPIPPGQSRSGFVELDAPTTATTITLTATATSTAVSDPNPGDNTTSMALTFSADPDIELGLGGPQIQDLALPFKLGASLFNRSKSTAHDVDVTIDFNADVAVRTLPPGCSNPAPGRITCHFDEIEPNEPFSFLFTLVAPPSYGSGKLVFSGRVTEREQDFDPVSNNKTATVALYATTYVTTTANEGPGSLRDALSQSLSLCAGSAPCTIGFRIDEPSATPWKTIRITTPLPTAFAPHLRIEGATQTGFFGDTNPGGPEIEISGGGTVDGDGLVITSCGDEVANLAVNGFRGNGIGVVNRLPVPACNGLSGSNLHHLYVGTDPTGSEARPNGRGITTALGSGDTFNSPLFTTSIRDSVISGNTRSGVFGLGGRLLLQRNRIGVKAHADAPLPNGNAGVYVGAASYGSDIGAAVFDAGIGTGGKDGNVIAFNGQMGIAVDGRVGDVAIRDNRIWGNGGLGIDIGLDGPTPDGGVPAPVLTLGHYDPLSKQTVVEGDFAKAAGMLFNTQLDFYASDAPALSGAGEAQRLIGERSATPGHFQFKFDGDLTGQFISVTATRVNYVGFDQVGATGIDQGFLTQTSEISRPIEVR
jgi:hypothetical protein